MQLTSGGLYGALRAPSLSRRLQLILVFYRLSFNSSPGPERLGLEVAARAGAPKRGGGPRVTPRRGAKGNSLAESSPSRQSARLRDDGVHGRRVMPLARQRLESRQLVRQPYALARGIGEAVGCAWDAPLYQCDL
jgi:hypothetical protein